MRYSMAGTYAKLNVFAKPVLCFYMLKLVLIFTVFTIKTRGVLCFLRVSAELTPTVAAICLGHHHVVRLPWPTDCKKRRFREKRRMA